MIPLSVPQIEGNEWQYVKDCLDTGWISSAGEYVNRFEKLVAEYCGAKYGVACSNGTVGIHIALHLLGVGREDYVIAPDITFIATLNAISYTGAQPILIDVDPRNWQMDLNLLEKFLVEKCDLQLINDRTICVLKEDGKRIAAIVPVHVLGNCGDLNRLTNLAKRFHLEIVEDATESLGTTFNGNHTGNFGKLGVFSFNGNKIISTGGGGVIVTNDEALAKRAKHLTTQAKNDPMEYYHDEIGYNYRLVNILAAIGVAQMEKFPEFLERKKETDAFYRKQLVGVGDIEFQAIDENVNPNCWLFTFKTAKMRELLKYLNANGVQSRPFWVPMHQLPMFQNVLFYSEKQISNTIYESCISIPSSSGITPEERQEVVTKIKAFYAQN